MNNLVFFIEGIFVYHLYFDAFSSRNGLLKKRVCIEALNNWLAEASSLEWVR